MISRETRASGLLRQLSRVRRMTATGLVSETHMLLGSHNTVVPICEKCLIHVCSDPLQVESYFIQ